MKRVTVAVSGGVDSGVAAALLQKQGYAVDGMFMRHRYQQTLTSEESNAALRELGNRVNLRVYSVQESGELCQLDWSDNRLPFALPADSVSAMEVAASLGIQLTIIDADVQFKQIVADFVGRYYDAETPNPCVLCNRIIKFGLLIDVALKLGADYFATGHYVQKPLVSDWLEKNGKADSDAASESDGINAADLPSWLTRTDVATFIARSPSPKDQSYFLYRIRKDVLDRVIFPIGSYQKDEVRELAAQAGLPVAQRKDSQEVCFVPDRERMEFFREYRAASDRPELFPEDTSGPFLDLDGREIGRHGGYEKYTIGQRKGLGMGFGERVFVQKIEPESRAVVLGPYESLGTVEVHATDANWHVSAPFDEPFRCIVKIRYRNETTPATVTASSGGNIIAVLDRPCYGVAPGQALVCYWNDRLLGGGTIVR